MFRLLRLGVLLGLLCLAFTGAAIGAPGDTDNDTFADASDNCPTAYNFDQRDQDADGVGDVCDATPGVLPDRTIYYTYFRDRTTGGPLPSCAQLHWYSTPAGFDFNVCFFAFSSSVIGSGTVTIDVLSPPAGCIAETSSLTFGPPTAGQLGTVQTTTIWFVCTSTQLSSLAAASAGVGSGSSLADKVAAIQTAVAAGDTATACGALKGYINQVRAQSGKKIATATANDLIAKAEAIKTTLGC
jgi:hypothetical protein